MELQLNKLALMVLHLSRIHTVVLHRTNLGISLSATSKANLMPTLMALPKATLTVLLKEIHTELLKQILTVLLLSQIHTALQLRVILMVKTNTDKTHTDKTLMAKTLTEVPTTEDQLHSNVILNPLRKIVQE